MGDQRQKKKKEARRKKKKSHRIRWVLDGHTDGWWRSFLKVFD